MNSSFYILKKFYKVLDFSYSNYMLTIHNAVIMRYVCLNCLKLDVQFKNTCNIIIY